MRATNSSTGSDATQLIEPTENTIPLEGVSNVVAAFEASQSFDAQPLQFAVVVVHAAVGAEFHFAVQPVAAEVREPPALLEHPPLHALVHPPRPVLRVNRGHQHAVRGEVE